MIDNAIKELEDMKTLDPTEVIRIVRNVDLLDKTIYEMFHEHSFEQAVIHIINIVFPNARYGFDYNPAIKPDKNGREKCAQGWVRISSPERKFNSIDWSMSHKFPGIAMLIALLYVLRDYKSAMDRINGASKLPA